MEFTAGQYIQLGIALLLGAAFLIAVYSVSEKTLLTFILVMIPFQPLDSRFGTMNEYLVLAIAGIYFLRGRLPRLPMLGAFLFVMIAYLLSLTQAIPGSFRQHALYILAAISNFLLFWLVYNFILRHQRWQTIFLILGIMNALVIFYCALQVVFGSEQVALLAGTDLTFNTNQEGAVSYSASRITSPFSATAMAAEYFNIAIIICGYYLIHEMRKRPRMIVFALLAFNLAFLVMTGNRGGIVSLAVGAIAFLYMFKRDLGLQRALVFSILGTLLFAVSSVLVVSYTEFGAVFERLVNTEFEEGYVPDSRAGWIDLWPFIFEKPIFGHGPMLALDPSGLRVPQGYTLIPPPHNLFMWLIYTIGAFGLAAYAFFFIQVWNRCARVRKNKIKDKMLSGIPRLGIVILIVFLSSEMRMELMRWKLHDYQQFFFMVLAILVAFSDLVRVQVREDLAAKRLRIKSATGNALPAVP